MNMSSSFLSNYYVQMGDEIFTVIRKTFMSIIIPSLGNGKKKGLFLLVSSLRGLRIVNLSSLPVPFYHIIRIIKHFCTRYKLIQS